MTDITNQTVEISNLPKNVNDKDILSLLNLFKNNI